MKMGLIHRITLLPLVAATLANAQNDATTTNNVTPMDEITTEDNTNNSANMTNNNATIIEEEETDTGTAPNYTPEECNSWVNTIVSADADSSNGLSESEYHNFLSSINDPPYIEEYFSNYDSFDNLPWVFRVVHKSLACHCEKLGKGEECCEGDNAEVLLLGLDDSTGGRAAGAGEEEYKDLVCQQISYILAKSVPSPAPTSGPTETPTDSPSGGPTSSPSVRPTSVTNLPTISVAPTSLSPTLSPVQTPPEPTVSPVTPPAPETPQPTDVPSISLKPSIKVVLAAVAAQSAEGGNTGEDEEDGGLGIGGVIGILVALLAIILAILALITYRRKQEQQRLKQFAGDQAPEGDLEAPVVPVVKAEVAPEPVPEMSPEPEQAGVEPNEDDESSAPSVWSAGDEDGEGGANADLMDDNLDVSATVGSSLAAMGAAGAAVTMINKSESQ